MEAPLRTPPTSQWSALDDRPPGWFDQAGPTQRRLGLEQGGPADGWIARDQIAETIFRSPRTSTALRKTFELIAAEGEEPSDRAAVAAEPQAVRTDLEAVRSLYGTNG